MHAHREPIGVAVADASTETDPFYFRGGPVGCLLIHGFTGTPQEMRFLGGRLAARGLTASGVQLAGHCTSIEDFEHCRWIAWYNSAREALVALRANSSATVVVGQSMGALLALKLAAEHPEEIAGVALLSPAVALANPWLRWLRPAFPLVLPLLPARRRYVGKGESDIADPQARAASPNYRRVPLRALHQLLELQHHVRRVLPQVRQPVLVIHSRQDHTCPVTNVAVLEHGLPQPPRTVVLQDSYHVISVDVDRETVAAEVAAFVEQTGGLQSINK